MVLVSKAGIKDHPRVCGEKQLQHLIATAIQGSPPRERGKVAALGGVGRRLGITPACAGKSILIDLGGAPGRDHPRVCGEKGGGAGIEGCALGSPPRVRGKVVCVVSVSDFEGITPACAGKSYQVYGMLQNGKDHPRVCGEKHLGAFGIKPHGGSPPRVRGKVTNFLLEPNTAGITPACAGKREEDEVQDKMKEDHPRVCGEKVSDIP